MIMHDTLFRHHFQTTWELLANQGQYWIWRSK